MKRILLTKGLFSLVDDDDYERLSRHRWQAHKSGNSYYARRAEYVDGRCTSVYMHRVILNAPGDVPVDHGNGNSLDNRKSNLRACSYSQNQANRGRQKNNRSGYKGVVFIEGLKRPWMARINWNKERIAIGYFTSAQEAADAYAKKAQELFGEYVHL